MNSNAIVLAKDGVAWGIGAGQQNVESGEIAAAKAAGRAEGGHASDAFYPFPDGIHAADAGGDHRAARWFGR